MKKFITLSLIATLSLTALANEESKEEAKVAKAPADFASIDKNSDGFISMEESESVPHLKPVFKKLDKNADQKLNQEEYKVFMSAVK